MDREQLDQRNSATIRKHWRTLTDNGGQPPQQLLDDLATIADKHAGDAVTAASKGGNASAANTVTAGGGGGGEQESGPLKVTPARTTPRRTTARRTAK